MQGCHLSSVIVITCCDWLHSEISKYQWSISSLDHDAFGRTTACCRDTPHKATRYPLSRYFHICATCWALYKDALLDRQVINTNWMNEYKTVRTAIDASYPLSILQDDESIRLLQDTKSSDSLTYFDCKKILDRLIQSSESKQTNILGQVSMAVVLKGSLYTTAL